MLCRKKGTKAELHNPQDKEQVEEGKYQSLVSAVKIVLHIKTKLQRQTIITLLPQPLGILVEEAVLHLAGSIPFLYYVNSVCSEPAIQGHSFGS